MCINEGIQAMLWCTLKDFHDVQAQGCDNVQIIGIYTYVINSKLYACKYTSDKLKHWLVRSNLDMHAYTLFRKGNSPSNLKHWLVRFLFKHPWYYWYPRSKTWLYTSLISMKYWYYVSIKKPAWLFLQWKTENSKEICLASCHKKVFS